MTLTTPVSFIPLGRLYGNNLNSFFAQLCCCTQTKLIKHFCISRHYRQAYGLLGELKTSDINMLEIKVVAGFVNYKVCYHTCTGEVLIFNPFAPGDFAEKRVLRLVEWFSGHCRAIKG